MSTPAPYSKPHSSAHRSLSNDPEDPIAIQAARLQARIARLQAQEKRQRLIDDLEPRRKAPRGLRFVHAFLLVLGLHVVAIGGFFGVSAIKKNHASDKLALMEKPPVYTGVPEASPAPSHSTDETPKAALNQDPSRIASKETKTSAKKIPPTKSRHHTPTEPSAKVRELFAKMHPSASAGSSSKGMATEGQPATQALTGMVPPITHPSPKVHKVRPGDSLAQIAKANGIKTAALRDANHLDQSDDLQVGQRLTLPAPDAHPPLQLVEQDPESTTPKADQPEQFLPKLEQIAPNGIYTVQRGDNAYMVARRLGVSFTDLMTANAISNPADVTIGMRLKVPGGRLASN